MEEPEDLRRATELWREAYRNQMDGELDRTMSATSGPWTTPTPPRTAHLHGLGPERPGRLDEATEEGRRAIEVDPNVASI
jgi:hypothetical protein